MEEKRNITISLKEAREWYKSNNKALREIALKAYSENELSGYDYIKNQVSLVSAWYSSPNTVDTYLIHSLFYHLKIV